MDSDDRRRPSDRASIADLNINGTLAQRERQNRRVYALGDVRPSRQRPFGEGGEADS